MTGAATAPPIQPGYTPAGPSLVRTHAELEAALRRDRRPHRRLGEILVQAGLATQAQIDAVLEQQRAGGHREFLGEMLVARGLLDASVLRGLLASQLGLPSVDLAHYPMDANALKALSAALARKYQVLPLLRTDTQLAIAVVGPLAWQTERELAFYTGLQIVSVFAAPELLAKAVREYYGLEGERIGQLVAKLDEEGAAASYAASQQPVSDTDNTLVRLVNKMILDAQSQRASDIHIESRPDRKSSRVRFRIDGELRPYIEVPPNFRSALVSRLKIMCGLDIAEHRRPQDGKILFESPGAAGLEMRVVIMPTLHGLEDVVLRLLAPPQSLTLDQLGLSPRVLAQLKEIAQRSFGLLFVCGPTGSGKTTTLHSLLGVINTPARKIWTVEDPIEITQDGLCQVEVNAKLGLTFPAVLRSFLRADPDVIMVGETRDAETANTVTAASLTGHLVVSTMHTNSAAESVVRLLDFGLDPFNFSDALLAVMGQRLVRRLCKCKEAYVAGEADIQALTTEYCRDTKLVPTELAARWRARFGRNGAIMLNAPRGCPACENTGYKGRQGVYELLIASPAIKAEIQQRQPASEILQRALMEGMVTFEQDGIEKILQGQLDLRQVLASCR